jgi:hypothetical protein
VLDEVLGQQRCETIRVVGGDPVVQPVERGPVAHVALLRSFRRS